MSMLSAIDFNKCSAAVVNLFFFGADAYFDDVVYGLLQVVFLSNGSQPLSALFLASSGLLFVTPEKTIEHWYQLNAEVCFVLCVLDLVYYLTCGDIMDYRTVDGDCGSSKW